MKQNTYTYEQVSEAIENSETIKQFLINLGLKVNNGNYRHAEAIARKHGLVLKKYDRATNLNSLRNLNTLPDEEYFAEGVLRNGPNIKKRLINDLGFEDICSMEGCGQLPEWNGQKLTLQVDHINGDRFNNLVSNLRILCPNCHTQTSTYGNNRGRKTYNYCECGNRIGKKSKQCKDCSFEVLKATPRPPKVTYPPTEELVADVVKFGYLTVASKLGVSDNAIRRHLVGKLGKDNIPKGMPKLSKPRPLTAGQVFLRDAVLEDVLAELEKPGVSVKSLAALKHVDPKALRSWLETHLGEPYVSSFRNVPMAHRQAVVYPPVPEILTMIANLGAEATARQLGVTSRAVDRHLRKYLPAESFPFSKSGILSSYRSQ